MHDRSREVLFGGALFAAGVVTSAQAQWTLVPSYGTQNYSAVEVISYNTGTVVAGDDFEYHDLTFNLDTYNDADVGGFVRSYISTSSLGSYVHVTPGVSGLPGMGYAYVVLKANITVSEDVEVLAEWSFQGSSGPFTWESFDVFSSAEDDFIFNANSYGYNSSGSVTFIMESGDTLWVDIDLLFLSTPSHAWARLTVIPSPSALAVLAATGVIGVRRRRRRSDPGTEITIPGSADYR